MFLNSVIIILREVLEASLLISILLAISGMLGLSRKWVAWAVGAGVAGAITYSLGMESVSDWFDGVGQEVINAGMQFVIFFLLLVFAILVVCRDRIQQFSREIIMLLMAAIVAVAITREGVEVLVYLYGFSHMLPQFLTVVIGAVIGAGIGISLGALVYYFMLSLKYVWSIALGIGLLALVAAGMLSQAVLLLIQADWLPSQLPLWDSSDWVSENSVTGQLLYALIGYEATPTAIQAGFYFGGLLLFLVMTVLAGRCGQQSDTAG